MSPAPGTTKPSGPAPAPPPAAPPSALQAAVSVAFFVLLGAAWWLDQRGPRGAGGEAPRVEPGRFGFVLQELAAERGLDFVHRAPRYDEKLANIMPHVAGVGAAVSVCYVDADGWPDLYVTSSAPGAPNALFVNRGAEQPGHFDDRAAAAGVADVNSRAGGVSMGSLFADVDNDGDEDFVLYMYGRPRLFRNEHAQTGTLRFTDVTDGSGIDAWRNSHAAVWLDYDRDGHLDLYLGGYFREEHDLFALESARIMQESFEFAANGGHNALFRNLGPQPDGALRFADVTADAGVDSTRWTMAAATADFDADGWPDLYVANDYGPEQFFLNQGPGPDGVVRFVERTDVGLGDDSKSGMAVSIGDVTNRGDLAVYVTNISKSGYLFQGNNLRLNLLGERGRFLQMADGVVADCGWAWGAQFGDLDNDGYQDLFVVNGFVSASPERDYWYAMSKVAGGVGGIFEDAGNWSPMEDKSLSGYERSRVLLNNAGRGFADVATAVGVDDVFDGRAVVLADLENRGALDVVVANQRGPLLLYRNTPDPSRHWIGVTLTGTTGNRSAIGAAVKVTFAGPDGPLTQLQFRGSSSGFSSQNDGRLHFGLGAATRVDRLEVTWPSGAVTTLTDLPVDRFHALVEPAG